MKIQHFLALAMLLTSNIQIANAQWHLNGDFTNGEYIGTNNVQNFDIHTGGYFRMRVDSLTGYIGIATFTPRNLMHIHGGSGASYSQFTNTLTTDSFSTSGFRIGIDANGNAILFNKDADSLNGNMNFYTDSIQRMTIYGLTGYVGIGTAVPYNLQHLHRAGANSLYTQYTNTTTGNTSGSAGFRIGIDANGNAILFNKDADSLNGNMNFYTDSIQRMTIYGLTGYVGIGTAAPQEKLEVNGSILCRGKILVAGDDATYDLLALIRQLQTEVAALKQQLPAAGRN